MPRDVDRALAVTRRAQRDAVVVTALLGAAIYAGSGSFEHFDPALTGYCVAAVVTCFAVPASIAAFWRRPPSPLYGRALLSAVWRPRQLFMVLRATSRNIVAQRFLRPRGAARWLAHLLLSWGTLVGFA